MSTPIAPIAPIANRPRRGQPAAALLLPSPHTDATIHAARNLVKHHSAGRNSRSFDVESRSTKLTGNRVRAPQRREALEAALRAVLADS